MTTAQTTIDVHLEAEEWQHGLADAARRSLGSTPPYLDPVWFYDERGSDLFEDIARVPEYYLTRTERALLRAHADDIAAAGVESLVELGSGASDKTTVLLDAMVAEGSLRRYVPFDVSEEMLRRAVDSLAERYPGMAMHGVVGDFHHHLGEIPPGGRRMVAFLGSTIGNLQPNERSRFFGDVRQVFGAEDRLLLGIDLVKDPAVLLAAYDDSAGVTAEFNRNALRVLNAALGCDFDAEAYDHVAKWDAENRWIEMRLRARADQVIHVPGLDGPLLFAAGDELRTEISSKFTVDSMADELGAAGFDVDQVWQSDGTEYALILAKPR